MAFGQSAVMAVIGSGLVKRGAYLFERATGTPMREADARSDEYAITAAYTIGTATGLATADPVGMAGTAAYAALMEKDLKEKRGGA